MSYKSYPFSRKTYYRRKRKAAILGCDIMDVPDGRGKHGEHVKGERHYRWQTGKHITIDGYVRIRVGITHPHADPNGYAFEHTLVWISAGHSIEKEEVLHHISGDRQDNRLENLQKMTRAQHNSFHLPERNPDTGQFIKARAGHLLDGREWREYPNDQP